MISIAVIDDEPKIRRGISEMLRSTFLQKAVITDFPTVQDILEYAARERIDILITDICMPDMDGLLLAKHLKPDNPGIQIIVISGYSEFEYAKTAISLHVCEYLLKPLEPDVLIKTVRLAMERLEKERRRGKETDRTEKNREKALRKASMPKERLPDNSWDFDAGKEAMLVLNRLCRKEDCADLIREMERKMFENGPDDETAERGMEEFLNQLQSVFEKDDAMGTICAALEEMKERFSYYENSSLYFTDLNRLLESAGKRITNVRNMRSEQNMKKALAFIEKNYCYDLSLEEVAQQAHFNPSYFSSYFKKYTGMSLINYLMELRLKRAKELLKNPEIRIREITNELGFHDTRYFARIFKKITGVTPSEYRSIMLQIDREDP